MTDRVTLIKQNGERRQDIPASVQQKKIFINDASLVIEEGDLLERVTSNGLREAYEVVEPGFHEKFGSIDAHYQIEVRRSAGGSTIPSVLKPQPTPSSGLHPWAVISAVIFDLESDDVVEIISLAGLQVDWSVNHKESYSHSTRKRAYRPRVDAAFSKLNDSDRLRVSWVASSEIVQHHPDKESLLRERLSAIGWTLNGGAIRPASGEVAELFFPRGSQHDAYVQLRELLQAAQRTITIVDPYLDSSILTLLGTCSRSLDIQLLTYALPIDFLHEIGIFRTQHRPRSVEVRRTAEFHDRFIVADGSRCFHIGSSIKDAGRRAFMINQVQDHVNIRALLAQIRSSWEGATAVEQRAK